MTSVALDNPALRHIIVVGGTAGEWAATTSARWVELLDELGKVADQVGAGWLTMRPYEADAAVAHGDARTVHVGACLVTADPDGDGHRRVTDAVNRLQARGAPITEAGLAGEMNAPADADPDLVVVIGGGHRLPPSLVWELAYSELVFIDATWTQLAATHLDDAIDSYAHRHRRFGGVD